MVKYAENELFSITDFTKQISSLLKNIKNNSIEKIGILKNNRLEVVVLSTEEYSRLKKIEEESNNLKWRYWKDEELDNFGKIAIGLSRHDYDNEDYSKW
ncbi:hypothetical protein MNB_SV-14-1642 [hydrothermal vent metagenome]|uniref:Antitoxin n=1 Tax=hydrothermal vent metagenome TaxID=652676 RepID=A0A1W1CU01_9ZZZZ